MLLMAVAGVCPEEIAKGIAVQPIAGGVQLKIQGAKIDRGHGQPERVITVHGPLALMLAESGERTIKAPSANSVSLAAGRLGRKVFGDHRSNPVSAYSFRHQFASDLKASGLDSVTVSAILGHSVGGINLGRCGLGIRQQAVPDTRFSQQVLRLGRVCFKFLPEVAHVNAEIVTLFGV